MWSMDKILKLEEENRLRKVEGDMRAAKHRNQQQAINMCSFIVSEQTKLIALAMFCNSPK